MGEDAEENQRGPWNTQEKSKESAETKEILNKCKKVLVQNSSITKKVKSGTHNTYKKGHGQNIDFYYHTVQTTVLWFALS